MDLETRDFTFDANWFLARAWKGVAVVLAAVALIMFGFNGLSAWLAHNPDAALFGHTLAPQASAHRVVFSPRWLLPVLAMALLTVGLRLSAFFVLNRTSDLKKKKFLLEVFIYAGEAVSILAMKFSGGLQSPMCLYFLAHTVVIASVMPYRKLAWHIAYMSVLLLIVGLGEFTGLIPHTQIAVPEVTLYQDYRFVFFVTLSVIGYMAYIGFSSWNIFRKMEERRRALAAALAAKKDVEFYQDLMQHDLTNANHALLGNLSLLERTTLDQDQQRYVDACMKQVRKSDHLIARARAFAWVGELSADTFQPLDLGGLLNDAAKIVKAYYVGRALEINFTPHGTPCRIMATELLNAAIINILDNAVKHNPREKVRISITVSEDTHAPSRFWRVRVEDNGPGVFADMKQTIFERYATIGAEKHTGLGLSLARTIIEKHEGRVWVDDRIPGEPERGSAFQFTLPRH
jgi:signal transduction histidine kinase